ncbi:hypothetical protein AB205_0155110, partial [Aquarana catesbeiana]
MDSYTVLYLMLGLVQLKLLLEQTTQRRKKRPNRRYWVHPTVSRRLTKGHFHTLYHELRRYPQKFYDYAHMRVSTFDALLEILRPRLMRARTNMRLPVSAEERLLVTLRSGKRRRAPESGGRGGCTSSAADNGDLAANPPQRPPLSYTEPAAVKMDTSVVAADTEISIFKVPTYMYRSRSRRSNTTKRKLYLWDKKDVNFVWEPRRTTVQLSVKATQCRIAKNALVRKGVKSSGAEAVKNSH